MVDLHDKETNLEKENEEGEKSGVSPCQFRVKSANFTYSEEESEEEKADTISGYVYITRNRLLFFPELHRTNRSVGIWLSKVLIPEPLGSGSGRTRATDLILITSKSANFSVAGNVKTI
jgi:hypothetical protein